MVTVNTQPGGFFGGLAGGLTAGGKLGAGISGQRETQRLAAEKQAETQRKNTVTETQSRLQKIREALIGISTKTKTGVPTQPATVKSLVDSFVGLSEKLGGTRESALAETQALLVSDTPEEARKRKALDIGSKVGAETEAAVKALPETAMIAEQTAAAQAAGTAAGTPDTGLFPGKSISAADSNILLRGKRDIEKDGEILDPGLRDAYQLARTRIQQGFRVTDSEGNVREFSGVDVSNIFPALGDAATVTQPAPSGEGRILTPGKGLSFTAEESKASSFGSRAFNSNAILDSLDATGFDATTMRQAIMSDVDLLGNFGLTPDQQRFVQAKNNFINATLRKESGAAIGPSEFDRQNKIFFPQPGDSQPVIDQKRATRVQEIKSLVAQSGQAFKNQFPVLFDKLDSLDAPPQTGPDLSGKTKDELFQILQGPTQ